MHTTRYHTARWLTHVSSWKNVNRDMANQAQQRDAAVTHIMAAKGASLQFMPNFTPRAAHHHVSAAERVSQARARPQRCKSRCTSAISTSTHPHLHSAAVAATIQPCK